MTRERDCAVRTSGVLRVLPELRSKHIDQWRSLRSGEVFYFSEKYDLDATRIPGSFEHVGTTKLVLHMLRRHPHALVELPEPLWIREFPRTFLLSIVWRLGGLVHREPRRIVTYAIENNEPVDIVGTGPAWFRAAVVLLLRIYVRSFLDRIAFGTSAAQSNYVNLVRGQFGRSCATLMVPMLYPAIASSGQSENAQRVLFVGELSRRKGILLLMEAWTELEADRTFDGELTIIGGGPSATDVADWCQESPTRRKYMGFVPNVDLAKYYAMSTVLVAPSIRQGRWREQVGLPIIEGLSHGVRVVTTAETGIAEWLDLHGHHVVSSSPQPSELSQAIRDALARGRPRADVRADLPLVAGEPAARAWLLAEGTER